MAQTVKPPKRKTHHPPATPREPLIARLDQLAGEVAALRTEVAKLRGEVHRIRAGGARRQGPPPLPRVEEEIITVDEREVTLESLRPPRARR